jgi:hypothetical protein
MGCSLKGKGTEAKHKDASGKLTGLICNHAYGLNDIIELDDHINKGKKLRLLRLRNPWGNSEWNGAWGSGSKELKTYEKIL